jgi:hypothetical protein
MSRSSGIDGPLATKRMPILSGHRTYSSIQFGYDPTTPRVSTGQAALGRFDPFATPWGVTAICASPSPKVSAANVRFPANAARVRRLDLDLGVQGGQGARCGLVQCAGPAQFRGCHPVGHTQLLKAGPSRSSMKPNGCRLPSPTAAYDP